MKNLFSLNKAADLLEKDRATLVRALRHTAPDGHERGQPRFTMKTITDALTAHAGRVNGPGRRDPLRQRLDEIADELEVVHRELDAKREQIKEQRALDEKQPIARAAMKVFERLSALYDEADDTLSKIDPDTLLPFVSAQIVGTEFREILAAIWGRDTKIDGMPLFPRGYDQ